MTAITAQNVSNKHCSNKSWKTTVKTTEKRWIAYIDVECKKFGLKSSATQQQSYSTAASRNGEMQKSLVSIRDTGYKITSEKKSVLGKKSGYL